MEKHLPFEPRRMSIRFNFSSMFFPVILLLILVSTIGADEDELKGYQICMAPKTGNFVSLPVRQKCRLAKNEARFVKNGTVSVYVPSTNLTRLQAVRCSAVLSSYYNTNSIFGSGKDQRFYRNVTRSECLEMHLTRKFRGQPFVDRGDGLLVTQPDTTHQFSLVGHMYDVESFVVMIGTVATRDGKAVYSNLGDTTGCLVNDGECIRRESTIIWEIPNFSEFKYHVELGTYDAYIRKTEILIEEIQSVFTMSPKEHEQAYAKKFYGEKAIKCENDVILVVHNATDAWIAGAMEEATVEPPDTFENGTAYPDLNPLSKEANVRLTYVERKLREFSLTHVDRMWLQICNMHNRHVEAARAFLRVDPSTAIRMWLKRTNVSAVFAGDVLMIYECVPVNLIQIYKDHLIGDTCFHFEPVLTEYNVTMFVLPGTRDLVSRSERVHCDHVIHSVRRSGDEFLSIDGYPVQVTAPGEAYIFRPSLSRHQSIVFNAPSLFKSELSAALTTVSLINEQQRRIRDIEEFFDRELRKQQVDNDRKGLKDVQKWFVRMKDEVKSVVTEFLKEWGATLRIIASGFAVLAFALGIPMVVKYFSIDRKDKYKVNYVDQIYRCSDDCDPIQDYCEKCGHVARILYYPGRKRFTLPADKNYSQPPCNVNHKEAPRRVRTRSLDRRK
ncbi:hypothetical protein QR680_002866 [Steinernema hermaphroditum]|nr:hypothetical protein QR680_002866 [Steinernema hermaphroditum]